MQMPPDPMADAPAMTPLVVRHGGFQDADTRLGVVAELTARAGCVDDLLEALRPYADVVATEAGVITFLLFVDPLLADVVVAVEIYADARALDAHLAAPARMELDTKLENLLEHRQLRWLKPAIRPASP